ncbi:MAG: hypothetical protein WA071_10870 [Undibacterium umbellatum]|uniref:hypothetical protein n=1 Tax=Undibacterium umbellatum TaxID=2762300 RepID=UPI003BB4D4F8
MMDLQLPDAVYAEITELCKNGELLAKNHEYLSAKQKYTSALRLVPEKHQDWQAATWIYVAIGDMNLKLDDREKAFKCFINAVQCPKGLGNPYIHLRLGQLYFEQNYFEKSIDELTRAYMGGGLDIFMEDDPKYLEFLESRINI